MLLKSLIRIFFIECSLNAIFDKLRYNLSFSVSTPGNSGELYTGPLYPGMRFSKMVWNYHSQTSSLYDIEYIFNDVIIHELGEAYSGFHDEISFMISFTYYDSKGNIRNDRISSQAGLTFYL